MDNASFASVRVFKGMNLGGWEKVDWVVLGLSILAKYLAWKKDKRYWVLQVISQVPWAVIVWRTQLWGLAVIGVISTVMSVRGYYLWAQDDKKCTCFKSPP